MGAAAVSALRDAALGYAARGIPVLPLHHPLPRPRPVSAYTFTCRSAYGFTCRSV
jgi:hypothetical protein